MPVRLKQQIKLKLSRYSNLLMLLAASLFAVSLIRNIIRIRKVDGKIEKAREKVVKLGKKNETLRNKLEITQSDEYLERQIRNELGLAKEGESIVILPDDEVLTKLIVKRPGEEDVLPDPIWKKWARLFGF